MRYLFVFFAASSILATAVASEPDKQALSLELANCAATYVWGASIARIKEEEPLRLRLSGLSRDALDASKFIAASFAGQKADEFVDHAIQMEFIRLESSALQENAEYYAENLEHCLKYEGTQTELLSEIRKSLQ